MSSPAVSRSARASQRRRRTAEETQNLLLDAGLQLALKALDADDVEQGGPLAHIRVRDVCEEASRHSPTPITTGAAYHLWANQRAFQTDLMFHILEKGAFASLDEVLALSSELFAAQVPLQELAARLCDESFRIEIDSPVARAAIAFKALSGVPAVRDALRASHAAFLESGHKVYQRVLTYGGLRVRDPYTLDQLMTVIGAMAEGLQVTHGYVPEQFETPDDSLSLVALASVGVFNAFCEPDPDAPTAAL